MIDMKFEIGDLVTDTFDGGIHVVVGRVRDGKIRKSNRYTVVQVFSLDEDEMLEMDLYEVELKEDMINMHVSRKDENYIKEIESINDERAKIGLDDVDYQSLFMDFIDYFGNKSIDKHLDTINDLENLYKMFGDKEYLETRDKIVSMLSNNKK